MLRADRFADARPVDNPPRAVSENTYDSPNPGVTIVAFDTDLTLRQAQRICVFLMPGEMKETAYTSVL